MDIEHQVVIIGGGFAGLNAAKTLKHAPVKITLIDRRNFHLFQPLLYQVATGDLSAANIASPLRTILRKQKNAHVVMDEVTGFDVANKKALLKGGEVGYDSLIVAAGGDHNYYGNDRWQPYAPSLKFLEDAFDIRNRIVRAFENAEKEKDVEKQKQWMSFVVVGGGATGMELAGSLAEIATDTVRSEYNSIDPSCWKITLVEGLDRLIPQYPQRLSYQARKVLESKGIRILTGAMVSEIDDSGVVLKIGETTEFIPSKTVIWAAGVKASPLGKALSDATGCELDKGGRVIVDSRLNIPGHPEIFVVGDLAHVNGSNGNSLPGLAPVAIQEGEYAAHCIMKMISGRTAEPFKYFNRGMMSILGRGSAVAVLRGHEYSGTFAWLLWLFVHLMYILQFGNRLLIMTQWAWEYFSRNHHARLLTEKRDRLD